MKCPAEYWIWLQRTLGAGKRITECLEYFGDPVRLYEAGRKAWIDSGKISKTTADKLAKYSPSQSYEIMKLCRENGWHIITCDDAENYPSLLKEIYNFPTVLYVWGDASVLKSNVCISIVGTRNASDYGLKVTESLAYSLAESSVTIVSGGALGVDSMAHSGAIAAHGKTIAFLGCGLGYPYLKENGSLRRKIAQNGAVVSEYPPFTPPTRQSFPIRNRLISGMSLGTVVIEAGEKSGSLITSKFALEQGRDVFAVPGDVMNSNYFGTNSLIRDGAKAVFSYMDILDEYVDVYGQYLNAKDEYLPIKSVSIVKPSVNSDAIKKETIRKTAAKKSVAAYSEEQNIKRKQNDNSKTTEKEVKKSVKAELPSYATENAKKVLSVMSDEPQIADKIISLSGLSVGDVLSSLTELELYGLITLHSGKRYSLKN